MSPRSTKIGPALASCAVHLLLLALAVWIARPRPPAPGVDTAASPALPRIVFYSQPGPGGGGGGGGRREVKPARRAQAPGADAAYVHVSPPPMVQPATADASEPVEAPVLAAVNMAASLQLHPGVIDQRAQTAVDSVGPGSDRGAGTGPQGGDGGDPGRGIGRGRDQGTGGEVYQPGNGVTPPRLIYGPAPIYTSGATRARISGSVLLECIVEPDGRIRRARIMRSLDSVYGLDEQAIQSVSAWRFIPGTRAGEPVAVRVTVETSFTIH